MAKSGQSAAWPQMSNAGRGAVRPRVRTGGRLRRGLGRRRPGNCESDLPFQALRIAVNDTRRTRPGLRAALEILRIGGRMAVISFIRSKPKVKQFMPAKCECVCPPDSGVICGKVATLREIARKAVRLGAEWRQPRARPAKLRAAEKLPIGTDITGSSRMKVNVETGDFQAASRSRSAARLPDHTWIVAQVALTLVSARNLQRLHLFEPRIAETEARLRSQKTVHLASAKSTSCGFRANGSPAGSYPQPDRTPPLGLRQPCPARPELVFRVAVPTVETDRNRR